MKTNFFELIELTVNDNPIDSAYIYSFTIFSSIEQPALQFQVAFNDKMDMRTLVPLKGGEAIVFSVVDQFEQKVDLNFTVTKVEVLTQKISDATVVLKAVSTNGLLLASQRVHASYENTPSKIVQSVAPFVKVTETTGEFPVTASGWTKTKLIQKLSQLAFNEKYKAMYMFYENLTGTYFKPLNELLDVKEVMTYTINDNNTNNRYNIIEWTENKAFDITASAHENMYNNTYVHYNPETKRIYSSQVKAKDVATETASLGKGQVFKDDLAETQGTKLVPYIIESEGQFYPKAHNTMGFALYTKKMQALLNGDLSVQVGSLINVNMIDRYNPSEFASETAGLWLVEKASYHFTPEEFKMKLQVTKNATYSGDSLNGGKIVNPTVKGQS